MKYFLHDTNALDDEKVAELYMNFGYEGVGLFYCTLEKIAKQEKPVKTMVLKKQLKVGKKLERVWSFMEEIGLILSSNGETFNEQLLNFSEKYKIKKESTAKRVSEWREKQRVTENVTSYERVRNTPKVKESKVKNIDIVFTEECKTIISYLNEKSNREFKSSSTKNISLIKSRYNEGYAVNDFKKVIDFKVQQWFNDEKMNQYLCPETLFGNKFENYLQACPKLGFSNSYTPAMSEEEIASQILPPSLRNRI